MTPQEIIAMVDTTKVTGKMHGIFRYDYHETVEAGYGKRLMSAWANKEDADEVCAEMRKRTVRPANIDYVVETWALNVMPRPA
jgi:hypothetical protein